MLCSRRIHIMQIRYGPKIPCLGGRVFKRPLLKV